MKSEYALYAIVAICLAVMIWGLLRICVFMSSDGEDVNKPWDERQAKARDEEKRK